MRVEMGDKSCPIRTQNADCSGNGPTEKNGRNAAGRSVGPRVSHRGRHSPEAHRQRRARYPPLGPPREPGDWANPTGLQAPRKQTHCAAHVIGLPPLLAKARHADGVSCWGSLPRYCSASFLVPGAFRVRRPNPLFSGALAARVQGRDMSLLVKLRVVGDRFHTPARRCHTLAEFHY
jgi:hypothetical protein